MAAFVCTSHLSAWQPPSHNIDGQLLNLAHDVHSTHNLDDTSKARGTNARECRPRAQQEP
eukprot:6209601-Pleurochrysis_carterae.AAC.3